jgi:hypothetical protein
VETNLMPEALTDAVDEALRVTDQVVVRETCKLLIFN